MLDIFFERYKKNTINGKLSAPIGGGRKKSKTSEKTESTSAFKESMMGQIKAEDLKNEVGSFIEELENLQQEIIEKPSIMLIEKYRAKIGGFLKHILNNYQAIPFYKGIRNKIELKIWATVNTELDNIAKMVISENVNGFSVLSKLNMIKGLIVDLKVGK